MPALEGDAADRWCTPDRAMKMIFLPIKQQGGNDTDYRFEQLFTEELFE